MDTLQGVFPILNTTFDEDGRLDLESQVRLVDHLIEAGAHGLGLFGNASEGYALMEAERGVLLDLIVRRTGGRVPLVVSTGHNGTDGAVHLSREAQDRGASALMVLPPSFLKTDADGLLRYFEAISRAVSIPIMVQDAPLVTQVAIPAGLLARMAREIERVDYAKIEAPPTAPKVTEVLRAAAGQLTVFAGLNGQFLIEEYHRGARGVMPGSDLTRAYRCIWDHLERGQEAPAWDLFARVLPLIRFELQPGLGVSAMKHNLVVEGVIRSVRVRHPTGELAPEGLKELEFLRNRVRQGSEITAGR